MILKIAFDVPRHTTFDYFGVEGEPQPTPGARVLAQLGKTERIGVVMDVSEFSDLPLVRIKRIESALDGGRPVMSQEVAGTVAAVAHAGVLPVGRLAFSAIPPAARKSKSDRPAESTEARPRLEVQAAELPRGMQATTVAKVDGSRGKFAPHLLVGPPGSGKAETCVEAVARTLAAGGTCLVLVPEVGDIERWAGMIGRRAPGAVVAQTHGSLGGKERMAQWERAMAGGCHVVVGTRAAAFTPLPDLGLVVVDSENDPLHRTEHGLIYSTREVAAHRAMAAACPLLMSAAVPSLEVRNAAHQRRVGMTMLPRPDGSANPSVRIVDIDGRRLFGGVSTELEIALRNEVQEGGMAAVLVNRRGRSGMLYCSDCRERLACPRCHNALAADDGDSCACRRCGHSQPKPKYCPGCGSEKFHELRAGSSRVAEALATRLPEAKVLRIDADGDLEEAQRRIDAGDVDVVVGTRTLLRLDMRPGTCCVSDADTMLNSRNYHAAEHLLDTLTRLVGAGDGANLVIQTRFADHHVFEALRKGSYDTFAFKELIERKAAGLPPYRRYALFTVTGQDSDDVAQAMGSARFLAGECMGKGVSMLEPVPSATAGSEPKMQLLLSSKDRKVLLKSLHSWVRVLQDKALPGSVTWGVEVDPDTW